MPTAAAYALDRAFPDPSCKRCHIWRRTTRGTAHGSVPRTLTQHHILSDVSFLSRSSPSRPLSLLTVDLDLASGTDSVPFLTVTTSTMTSTLTTPATTQSSTDIPSSTSPSNTVSDTSSELTSTYISSLTSTNTLPSPVTPSSTNTIASSDSSSSSSSSTPYTSTTSVPETSGTAPTTSSSSTLTSSMTPRSLSTTRTSTSVGTSTSASDISTTSSNVVSSTSAISTFTSTTSSVGSSTVSSLSLDSTSSFPSSSSSTLLPTSTHHSSTSTTLTNTSSGVISGSSSVAPSTTFTTSSSSSSSSASSTPSSSALISTSQNSSSFSTSSLSSTISTAPSTTFSSLSFSASTTFIPSSTPFFISSSTWSTASSSLSTSSSPKSTTTPTTTSTSTPPAALQYTTTTVTPNLYTSTVTRTYVFTTTLPGDSTSSFTRVSTVITSGTLAPSAPASGPSLHKNSIIGIVVGGVLGIALVVLWMLFIVRRHHRSQANQAHQQGQHLSAQSFGNLGPGSAAALGLSTWRRRLPLEDDDDDQGDEEKHVMGSEGGRGGSISPPGHRLQVQGHQQQQRMMMQSQAYDGLLTAMGLPSSTSSSSGHGYDAASSSGHGAPPGTMSSSEVGLLTSNNGRRPSWGAIPTGSSATTTSRQYAFGQAAADLSPEEGVSGAGTPPLFPRSSGEGKEGVTQLASSEGVNRLSHISRDSGGMKPGAWLSGKEGGEATDEFGVENITTAPSTVAGTAYRSGDGTTSSSGHDDSDLPLSRGGKTATSTAPSSYNGRRPSVSSAPLAAFGTRSSESSLGHGGGGERDRDGRPIRSPSTLSAPIPVLISPYSQYASSSAHGHQNGGAAGGRESSLGHDSSGHNSGSGSGSAHHSQGQGPLITIRRPSPPTAYTRTMRSSSPDNNARTSANNTHGIRGLLGRIRSGSRASFSDAVSPTDRKRGSNNGLPAVPPPSVSLGRSGSALVMPGPSSLLNPVNAVPLIPLPPPPPPPPPPGEGTGRQPPWAVLGQPLTLPPTPAESFVDDSMADGSGFGEGLLDPRLNMRFRIGTAIDSARQSAASLGDHVDYSRPFGGLVYNRLNSFTTVGSNTSRRTRETDADTSHARTTES